MNCNTTHYRANSSSVPGDPTLILYLHSYVGLFLSLIALTALVPSLASRDRASNALIVYLSRPLTAFDYRLGKLGIIVGVLLLFWTGPLVFGWLFSLLLSPDRTFLTYSLVPMMHAVAFNLVALVVLAALAFGVSSLTRSSHVATLTWIGLWIFAGVIAKVPFTPAWLQHASFQYNLTQVQGAIFAPDEALRKASEELPMLGREFTNFLGRTSSELESRHVTGAWVGLCMLTLAGSAAFLRKLRPD